MEFANDTFIFFLICFIYYYSSYIPLSIINVYKFEITRIFKNNKY